MYSYEYLEKFTINVFTKMGIKEEDACKATKVFLAAELRGISSHGMI
jgi:LDH2 family malate/lactate/ureidoglycolate dehydrogenase